MLGCGVAALWVSDAYKIAAPTEDSEQAADVGLGGQINASPAYDPYAKFDLNEEDIPSDQIQGEAT